MEISETSMFGIEVISTFQTIGKYEGIVLTVSTQATQTGLIALGEQMSRLIFGAPRMNILQP
jgi:hypothetical protein